MFKHILGNVTLRCIALILAPAGVARSATILVDDFNDGNDSGWYCPFLPTCDPSSYAYHLQSDGSVAPSQGVGAFWSTSADPLYSNGLLRARVRNDATGTVAGPTMRNSPQSGYFFLANSRSQNFYIGTFRSSVGTRQYIVPDVSYQAGEEWVIEGGIVGDQLSMKVWRPDDPEPMNPQLVVTDRAPIRFSDFGVLSYVNGGDPQAQIDATFDDIYFTHIPPSGLLEDFNGDGAVNFADFLQFGVAYGSTRTDELVLFDLDTSGEVDFADFLQFSVVFGQVAGASAVPEPNSPMLTALGLLLMFGLRRSIRNLN